MEYNDTVVLSNKGFHIDKNLMLPIGIQSGYRLWGTYESGTEGNNTLIISSLPHAAWGGLLRIRIRLKKDTNLKSAIQLFSKVLTSSEERKNNPINTDKISHVNILSLNTSISMDSHYILSLIIELPELRTSKDKDKENKKTVNELDRLYEERYSLIVKIGKETELNVKQGELKELLYTRLGFTPIEVSPIKSLLKESMTEYRKPIRLLYKTEGMILQPNSKIDMDCILYKNNMEDETSPNQTKILDISDKQKPISLLHIAIFDPLSKIIRLQRIDESRESLYKIDIEYTYNCNRTVSIAKEETSCDICNILESIQERDNERVITMKKTITRYSRADETRLITLLMKVGGYQSKMSAEEIRNRLKSREHNKLTIQQISQRKVFISLRHPFKEDHWDFIEETLFEYGLQAITTEDNTEKSITERVINDMKQSSACIQIYSICRDSEKRLKLGDRKVTLDIMAADWLLFEWGIARSLGLDPVVRMLDTTHIEKSEWEKHLRMDRDGFLESFQTYTNHNSKDHFRYIFKKVAEEVAKQVYRSHPPFVK